MDELDKIIFLDISTDELIIELCWRVDELHNDNRNIQIMFVVNLSSEYGTHLCLCEFSSKRMEHD